MDDFIGMLVVIFLFSCTYYTGKMVDQSEVKFDCDSYGKTRIVNSGFYSCSKIEEKK